MHSSQIHFPLNMNFTMGIPYWESELVYLEFLHYLYRIMLKIYQLFPRIPGDQHVGEGVKSHNQCGIDYSNYEERSSESAALAMNVALDYNPTRLTLTNKYQKNGTVK